MPAKCALGCKINVYPMHVFPNPEKDPERFRAWVDVLGDDTPSSLTDYQIFKRLRICDKHFVFEHRARFKRLSAMAVPYRALPAPSVVETEPEEVNETEPLITDNIEEDDTVEIYQISEESDIQIAAEVDVKADGDSDDTSDIPSPTPYIDPNDPQIKSLLEDDFSTQSTPVMTMNDPDTAEMAEYYHRRWSVAQKKLAIQNNQLNRMRRKVASIRLSEKRALKIISKNMTQPAKLFLAMQMRTHTNLFTLEEEELSLSIYRKSPECYKLLTDYFVLPSPKIMERMNLESRLYEFNRRNRRNM